MPHYEARLGTPGLTTLGAGDTGGGGTGTAVTGAGDTRTAVTGAGDSGLGACEVVDAGHLIGGQGKAEEVEVRRDPVRPS